MQPRPVIDSTRVIAIHEHHGVDERASALYAAAGEDGEEGCGAADEPSKVREDGGHGQHDLPQRGVRTLQSAISLLFRIHLRQFAIHYIF